MDHRTRRPCGSTDCRRHERTALALSLQAQERLAQLIGQVVYSCSIFFRPYPFAWIACIGHNASTRRNVGRSGHKRCTTGEGQETDSS